MYPQHLEPAREPKPPEHDLVRPRLAAGLRRRLRSLVLRPELPLEGQHLLGAPALRVQPESSITIRRATPRKSGDWRGHCGRERVRRRCGRRGRTHRSLQARRRRRQASRAQRTTLSIALLSPPKCAAFGWGQEGCPECGLAMKLRANIGGAPRRNAGTNPSPLRPPPTERQPDLRAYAGHASHSEVMDRA